MALDALLREILVDPEDKKPLWYFEADALLYNPRLHRSYPIRDGIPVLLIGEATPVDDAAHAAFEARLGEAVVTGSGPAS
ncbi:MAG TPA: Trm112 family protein [Acidimicrobiales bacterium]